jgi:hypothetical protein
MAKWGKAALFVPVSLERSPNRATKVVITCTSEDKPGVRFLILELALHKTDEYVVHLTRRDFHRFQSITPEAAVTGRIPLQLQSAPACGGVEHAAKYSVP